MKPWTPLLFGAGFGAAFALGQLVPALVQPAPLAAQGRGPVNNPPPPDPKPGETKGQPEVVYAETGGGTAGSANGFLAVTGSYGVGTSVLYVLDTVNRQLAVYEARGGTTESRRLVLVGARRIDLDLQIESYNDRSEFDYPKLREIFDKRGRKGPDGKPAADGDASRK